MNGAEKALMDEIMRRLGTLDTRTQQGELDHAATLATLGELRADYKAHHEAEDIKWGHIYNKVAVLASTTENICNKVGKMRLWLLMSAAMIAGVVLREDSLILKMLGAIVAWVK